MRCMSRTNIAARRWRKIIRDQQASGLSVAEYCRRARVSAWSLYCWRRRLRAEPKAAAKFVEVKVARGSAEAPAEGPGGSPSGISLCLPGSRCIMVRPGFDGQTLLALLQVLEANPASPATEGAGP
jgi:hypothetical protein